MSGSVTTVPAGSAAIELHEHFLGHPSMLRGACGVTRTSPKMSRHHPGQHRGLQSRQRADEGQEHQTPQDDPAEDVALPADTSTADDAIARFCGEIILPSTPPELLAAASSTVESPAAPPPSPAASRTANSTRCRTRSPRCRASPAPATAARTRRPPPPATSPSVMVWPDAFITKARASTAMTVTIALRS